MADQRFDPDAFARLLLDARARRRQIEPPQSGPCTPEDAYRVQDLVAAQSGEIGGWKGGAKSPEDIPRAAPIMKRDICQGPAEWDASMLHMIGIEAEIAFRIDRDLGPNPEGTPAVEALDAIAGVIPAIEIVDTRLLGWRDAEPLVLLADNQSNGGLVCGPSLAEWQTLDLADQPIRLEIDGVARYEGRGGNTAGDPLRIFTWVVDHCVRCRGGLAKGSVVTTGSCSGLIFVGRNAEVSASFPNLGCAQVIFRG